MGRELYEQPRDVRVFVKFLAKCAVWMTIAALEYTRIRSFLNVVCNGTCSSCIIVERKKSCNEKCSWYHKVGEHGFCRGCDCPQWMGSRIDGIKIHFARLKCPQGKFSRAPGWFSWKRWF